MLKLLTNLLFKKNVFVWYSIMRGTACLFFEGKKKIWLRYSAKMHLLICKTVERWHLIVLVKTNPLDLIEILQCIHCLSFFSNGFPKKLHSFITFRILTNKWPTTSYIKRVDHTVVYRFVYKFFFFFHENCLVSNGDTCLFPCLPHVRTSLCLEYS